jgi:hypothetical protein
LPTYRLLRKNKGGPDALKVATYQLKKAESML